jgi:hypothetical protein
MNHHEEFISAEEHFRRVVGESRSDVRLKIESQLRLTDLEVKIYACSINSSYTGRRVSIPWCLSRTCKRITCRQARVETSFFKQASVIRELAEAGA